MAVFYFPCPQAPSESKAIKTWKRLLFFEYHPDKKLQTKSKNLQESVYTEMNEWNEILQTSESNI